MLRHIINTLFSNNCAVANLFSYATLSIIQWCIFSFFRKTKFYSLRLDRLIVDVIIEKNLMMEISDKTEISAKDELTMHL